MLLQTLVQLNILILATPALAGWSLMPPVHSGAIRVACIVWQFRAAETTAPRAETQMRQAALPSPVVLPRYQSTPTHPPIEQKTSYPLAPVIAAASSRPFPYAIRAP